MRTVWLFVGLWVLLDCGGFIVYSFIVVSSWGVCWFLCGYCICFWVFVYLLFSVCLDFVIDFCSVVSLFCWLRFAVIIWFDLFWIVAFMSLGFYCVVGYYSWLLFVVCCALLVLFTSFCGFTFCYVVWFDLVVLFFCCCGVYCVWVAYCFVCLFFVVWNFSNFCLLYVSLFTLFYSLLCLVVLMFWIVVWFDFILCLFVMAFLLTCWLIRVLIWFDWLIDLLFIC